MTDIEVTGIDVTDDRTRIDNAYMELLDPAYAASVTPVR